MARHIIIPTEAFPLQWPADVPRTRLPKRSLFGDAGQAGAPHGRAIAEVRDELQRMGARTIVISTNLPLRQDGLPMASATVRGTDQGAAVYWTERVNGALAPHVITCDRWNRLGCNLHAIALSLSALRGLDRWGAVRREQAFAGFRELPGASGAGDETPVEQPWREFLGGNFPDALDASDLLAIAKARHRRLIAEHHPDRGGDTAAAALLNRALEEAVRELAPTAGGAR